MHDRDLWEFTSMISTIRSSRWGMSVIGAVPLLIAAYIVGGEDVHPRLHEADLVRSRGNSTSSSLAQAYCDALSAGTFGCSGPGAACSECSFSTYTDTGFVGYGWDKGVGTGKRGCGVYANGTCNNAFACTGLVNTTIPCTAPPNPPTAQP